MKKLIVILLCLCSLFTFAACGSNTNKFVELADNQTLFIENNMFKNYSETVTTSQFLTYEASAVYNLHRLTYSVTDSVLYEGYYYYWDKNVTTDELYLGTATTTYTCKYTYLEYGINKENIVVKSTLTKEISYDYEGGCFKTMPIVCAINMNGYFTSSFDTLKTTCLELAKKIDDSTSKKYYIDTTTPPEVTTNKQAYTSTYYYFE